VQRDVASSTHFEYSVPFVARGPKRRNPMLAKSLGKHVNSGLAATRPDRDFHRLYRGWSSTPGMCTERLYEADG